MKFRYIAATTAALLILSPAAVANAAPSTSGATTVVDGLVGPLHLAVGPDKVVTVSEEFASKLTKVRGTTKTQLYSAQDWDVAGVDYRGSTLYFLESQGAGPDPAAARRLPQGHRQQGPGHHHHEQARGLRDVPQP